MQGLANSVFLPVFAIALVMLILKLNIDPAGPARQLDFSMFKTSPQKSIVPVAGMSPVSMPILTGSDYLEYQAQESLSTSVQLSEQLLQTYLQAPTRFGKLQSTAHSTKTDIGFISHTCSKIPINQTFNFQASSLVVISAFAILPHPSTFGFALRMGLHSPTACCIHNIPMGRRKWISHRLAKDMINSSSISSSLNRIR